MHDGTKNLIPVTERTKEEARELASKGGKRSGEVRRKKADLRKSMQMLLDSSYTQRNKDGSTEQIKGSELVVKTIMQAASDPKSRNWSAAVRFVMDLQAQNEQKQMTIKKQKLELEKLQAEIDLLHRKAEQEAAAEEQHNGKLSELIEGLKDDGE